MKQAVNPAKAVKPLGPYSHGIRSGDLLFCSGQVPIDPAHPSGPISGDVRAQSRQVLENLRLILEEAGLTFDHVVKTTVFLVNLAEFQAMNEVYAEYFRAPYAARSTVQVARLPRDAGVEIEAIAAFPAASKASLEKESVSVPEVTSATPVDPRPLSPPLPPSINPSRHGRGEV